MDPVKKEKWSPDGLDAALLFNLFQERVYNPDSYSAAGIYRHNDLYPIFGKYDNKNWHRYCQTQANRVKRHEKTGLGLSLAFKKLIKQAREKNAELLKKVAPWQEFENLRDEDDEDYAANDDDDSGDDEEQFDEEIKNIENEDPRSDTESLTDLVLLDRGGRFDPKNKRPSKTKTARRAIPPSSGLPTVRVPPAAPAVRVLSPPAVLRATAVADTFDSQPLWAKDQCSPTCSLLVNNDGRIRLSWKLPENWDGEIFIADDGMSIVEDTIFPKDAYFAAKKHFENEGIFDVNDVFFNLLTVEHRETHRSFHAANPVNRHGGRVSGSGDVVVRRTVAKFPFKVFKTFQDRKGRPEQSVLIDTIPCLGDWAVGYVEREQKLEELPTTTQIRRRKPASIGS